MTVHQAKGLEFPVVFVVNLGFSKGGTARFSYDEDFGLFARRLPDGEEAVRYKGQYSHRSIKKELDDRQALEESRIMYVAMTRAEKLLYVTTGRKSKPGDFFEILNDYAESEGGAFVRMATSVPSLPSVVEPPDARAPSISIDQLKEEARRAIDRVAHSRAAAVATTPPTRVDLSYSRLAMFRECPMKYALRYVYRLPLAPHEEELGDERHPHADALMLGTLIHRTLMHYHRRRKVNVDVDGREIFRKLCRDCPPEIVRAGTAMLDKYLRSDLSGTDTLYEEQDFHWRIDGDPISVVFEGKVDRIHRENGLLKIVDYKTGERSDETHRLQLGMYRLAMEDVLDERGILTSVFHLSTGREAQYSFSDDDLRTIRDEMLSDASRIADLESRVDVASLQGDRNCGACGYEAACPLEKTESQEIEL
jgi:ATP-dependent helicase/nuclease subunit A